MIAALIELTKPRITWLILLSTAIGYFFGVRGEWSWMALFHTMLGTALIASGTAALNQWYEWDADALMARTRNRPIPSGRVARGTALWFAVALSVLGFFELALGVNWLTGWLGLFTLASYLFLYTPLKRKSWHSTTVGAVPGAMPPMIGYAAAAGVVDAPAWALYAILFVWQFPHFYSIAWMYRDDYSRAGIRMLPVVEPDGASTARHILAFLLLLIPVSLTPSLLSMTGTLYLAGALVMGLYFLRAGWRVAREKSLMNARGVLLASVVYLPVLYGLMVVDRCSAVLLVAACGRSREPLESFNTVPDFTLTADSGEELTASKVLSGKVWVANFIYTTCPGPCPRTSRQMGLVQSKLAGEPEVRLVSFTVDPENDSPAALSAYAKRYGAEPGRWYFFTGSRDVLHKLSRDVFMLHSVGGQSADHSTRFVLVDRKGVIRKYYDSTEASAIDGLVAGVKTALKEPG